MSTPVAQDISSYSNASPTTSPSSTAKRRQRVAAASAIGALVLLVGVAAVLQGQSKLASDVELDSVTNYATKLKDVLDNYKEGIKFNATCTNADGVAQVLGNGMWFNAIQCIDKPKIGFKGKKGKLYTFVMVNPDWPVPDDKSTPDVKENRLGEELIWATNNIPYYGAFKYADDILPYQKSQITDDTGKAGGTHRMVMALLEQADVVDYMTAPRKHFKMDTLVKGMGMTPQHVIWYSVCIGCQNPMDAMNTITH